MNTILITVIAAIAVVGFFALAMSLTYIFKGHHIEQTGEDRLGVQYPRQEYVD